MFRTSRASTVSKVPEIKLPFYLKASPKDIADALSVADKKAAATLAVSAFYSGLQNKQAGRLAITEYYQLAFILMQKNTPPVLINLIGQQTLDYLKKIPAINFNLEKFKELCRVYPCVRPLPIAPEQIDEDDLTDTGHLVVTQREQIKQLIAVEIKKGKKFGRIRKEDVLGDTTCSAEFQVNSNGLVEIYWVYKGISTQTEENKLGHLVGKGSYGKIKVLELDADEKEEQKNEAWHVLKIQPVEKANDYSQISTKDERDDLEHKIAEKLGQAKGRGVRFSPSNKVDQEEIILRWIPGQSLRKLLSSATKTPTVFLMEIILNILKAIHSFHKMEYLHRDINPNNIMVSQTEAKLIDFGLSSPRSKKTSATLGSPGYFHPRATELGYSLATELYALGVTFAEALGFIDNASLEHCFSNFGKFLEKGGIKFISPTSELFKTNTVIPDEKDRAEILNFLNSMINLDPLKQPKNLDDCIAFFNKHFEKIAKTTPVETALIDINEFIASSRATRDVILNKAKAFPYVQCIERQGRKFTTKQLMLAHREFNKVSMVSKDLISVDNDLTHLPDTLKLCMERNKRFNFHFVTAMTLKQQEKYVFDAASIAHDMLVSSPKNCSSGFQYAGALPSAIDSDNEEDEDLFRITMATV